MLWLNEAERLRDGERPGEGVPSGTPPVGGEAAEKANSDSDLLKGLKNSIHDHLDSATILPLLSEVQKRYLKE